MAFTIQTLFSIASRDRCMAKLRKMIPLPSHDIGMNGSAAVLVPLCRVNGIPSLLYAVRSSTKKVSFPGGISEGTETAIQTALRKTKQDLGLSPEKINLWGQGPAIPGNNSELMITPVIGAIHDLKPTDLILNINEVSEAFAVPIKHLCDPKNQFYTQFSNGSILPVFYADHYKIWGIDAYITHTFLACSLSSNVYQNEWLKKKLEIKGSD